MINWIKKLFKPYRGKQVGHMTSFRGMGNYRKLLRGDITRKEYSKLDNSPVRTPIYDYEVGGRYSKWK